jgi:putative ABC transport system substrate-binding protein
VRIDSPFLCDIGAFVTIQEAIMRLRTIGLISTLVLGLLAGPLPIEGQQAGKVPRIGFLHQGIKASMRVPGFRQGLREVGYVEGQNITVEYRFAKGRRDRLAKLAAELVGLKLNVIVAATGPPALALKRATATIPIVMVAGSDPVALGLVPSLRRPGGNITGLTLLVSELSGKRLELLKEAFPKIRRVGVLSTGIQGPAFRATEAVAQTLGLELQSLELRSGSDLERVFEQVAIKSTDALITLPSPISRFRKRIVDFAVKSRLPAMFDKRFFVDAGGLMSYGASIPDIMRRAAFYVDRILKGAKPADMPVERPTKFELLINLKTAKKQGLTIPRQFLARADKVIK